MHELEAKGCHISQRLADVTTETNVGNGAYVAVDVEFTHFNTKFPLAAGLGGIVILVVQELTLLCSPGGRDHGGVPPVVTGS